MVNPDVTAKEPTKTPDETPLEAFIRAGFQITERKDQDILARLVEAFKILDLKDYSDISNYNHIAPYGKFAYPKVTHEFAAWMQDNKRKVLTTIIGTHKPRTASYAFAKTITLIQQAVAFVAKGTIKIQSMVDCDFVILELKDKETTQKLIKACLVHHAKLNIVVLFRQIQLTYNKICSISASLITSLEIYNAFKKALEDDLKMKVLKKISFKTVDEVVQNTKE